MHDEQRVSLFLAVSKKRIWNINTALGVCSRVHHKFLIVLAPAVAYTLISQTLGELCCGPYIREKVLQRNILN